MSYQVLARKYRPKSFDTLVGQEHVVRALTNALEQQRLHHAYLFTGTRGVGKTTLARIIAKAMNCETGITAKPCGICSSCTEIDRGRFVDLIEVDAASNTQVDAMRELLDNAQYAPTSGRFKVYIIDEVHMLSKNAFNAMLKTLEEPPTHVKFILATTDPQKVPVTVLSRCLQFSLRQMTSTSITSHLQNILDQENIPFETLALNLIARAAAGSMRDALSLTDQAIAYGGQSIKESEVRAMLGTVDQSYLYEILQHLASHDGTALMALAKTMEQRSISFEIALNDLANLLHQIAIAQTVPDSIPMDLPDRSILMDLAVQINAETLQLYYQIALLGKRDIALAPDEFAGFSMTLLRMLAFSPQENIHATVKQTATKLTTVTSQSSNAENSAQRIKEISKSATIPTVSNETTFNGDWRALLEQLKLGLARNLALNSALISYDENIMRFAIQDKDKALLNPMYKDKLETALQQHFSRKIQLEFTIEGQVNTPAKQVAQEKAESQSSAEEAIYSDQFVQALIQDFGAEIVPNSIKPLTQ